MISGLTIRNHEFADIYLPEMLRSFPSLCIYVYTFITKRVHNEILVLHSLKRTSSMLMNFKDSRGMGFRI